MKALPFGKVSTRPTTKGQKAARFLEAIARDVSIGVPPLPIVPHALSKAELAEITERIEQEDARRSKRREYVIRYRARKKAEAAAESAT